MVEAARLRAIIVPSVRVSYYGTPAGPIDLTGDPVPPPPPRRATGGPIRARPVQPAREVAHRLTPMDLLLFGSARRVGPRAVPEIPGGELPRLIGASEASVRDPLRSSVVYHGDPPIRDRLRAAANDAVGRGPVALPISSFVYPSEWLDEPAGVTGPAEELCVVCIDRKRATVCLPCGHTCLCVTCSRVQPMRRTCVICRTPLTEIKRLYS